MATKFIEDVKLTASLGEVIRAWRLAGSPPLTQEELARQIGGKWTNVRIAKLEAGTPKSISQDEMVEFARALKIPVSYLLLHRRPVDTDAAALPQLSSELARRALLSHLVKAGERLGAAEGELQEAKAIFTQMYSADDDMRPWRIEVVPINDIRLHEEADIGRVKHLVELIELEGMQRNPIILMQLGQDLTTGLIHVDGACRIEALRILGCRDVVAQVVDYSRRTAIVLEESWLHMTAIERPRLENLDLIGKWTGSHDEAARRLREGEAVVAVFFKAGDAITAMGENGLIGRVECIRQVDTVYSNRGVTKRLSLRGEPVLTRVASLLATAQDGEACVAFAPFSKAQVYEIARSESIPLLPRGITHHVLACGRVFNVNARLALLKDTQATPAEKTRKLRRELEQEREERFYIEPSIMYDDFLDQPASG